MLPYNQDTLEHSGELIVDLGPHPVSNRYIAADTPGEAPSFPLQLRINPDTGLIHLGKPFPAQELKPRYDWLTCFEPEDHLDTLVQKLITLPGVNKDSVFGAYSFKDDTTLRRLERLGYGRTWRLDPEGDLGVLDPCANVETYQHAFTAERMDGVRERRGAADVFIIRHVVEHAYDLTGFIEAAKRLTKPGGYIVWELPDCESALSLGDCTTIWEEHVYYFTRFTFQAILKEHGFSLVHFQSFPYALEDAIVAIVRLEKAAGSDRLDPEDVQREILRAKGFVQAFSRRRTTVRKHLEELRAQYGQIALFGAGHLSVTYLALMQLADLISCVVDDNPNKKGNKMPLGQIPIVGSDMLYSGGVRVCLLGLNPQNQPKVIAKHARFVEQGGIFSSIFPEAR